MKGIEEEEEEWRFNDYIIQSLSFRNGAIQVGNVARQPAARRRLTGLCISSLYPFSVHETLQPSCSPASSVPRFP